MSLYHYLAMAALVIPSTVLAAESTTECLKLVTYNVNMIPSYGNYTLRRKEIPKELSVLDADVYCLQEYWQECDIEVLVEKLKHRHPYHYTAIHNNTGKLQGEGRESFSPCSPTEVEYFRSTVLACADSHSCRRNFHADSDFGLSCLTYFCGHQLRAHNLSADCFSCILRYGVSTYSDGIDQCTPANGTCNKRLNAPGLILLSKKRITDAQYVSFFPDRKMTYQRGYLEAKVESLGKVVCTQLTDVLTLFEEYDSAYDDYIYQQYEEISNIISTFQGVDHFLLGDFRVGPQVKEMNVTGFSSASYNRLVNSGYRDPYLDQDGECTLCDKEEYSVLVDHIFIQEQYANVTKGAKRVLDSLEPYQVNGRFGVQVEVCPPNN